MRGKKVKTIAVLGPKGTFSDEVRRSIASMICEDFKVQYHDHIRDVVSMINCSADYAILPFENSIDGYIGSHMDLLLQSRAVIVAEHTYPIKYDFVYHAQKCHKIYVQYAAKNQCQAFMKSRGDEEIFITESNTQSLDHFLREDDCGAIIPKHLSESLKHCQRVMDVQDIVGNETRFLLLSKQEDKAFHALSDTLKVTLVISTKHDRPGLLYDILREFKKRDMSLISIMSRPTREGMGKYHFFIELGWDFSGLAHLVEKLSEIKPLLDFRILGVYPVLKSKSPMGPGVAQ